MVEASANPHAALQDLEQLLCRPADAEYEALVGLAKGLALRSMMQLEAASVVFDAAYHTATEHNLTRLQVRILVSRAANSAFAGRFDTAFDDLDRAAVCGGTESRGEVLHQRAGIHALAGDFESALKASAISLKWFRRTDARLWQARSLHNRSMMHLLTGRVSQGIRDAMHAIECYAAIGHPAGEAKARHNLAALLGWSGKTQEAFETFVVAEKQMQAVGIPLGTGADSQAEVLMVCGLFADAVTVAANGAREHRKHGARTLEAEATLIEGRAALALGDVGRAMDCARRSHDLFAEQGRLIHQSRADLLLAQSSRSVTALEAERLAEQLAVHGWEEGAAAVHQVAVDSSLRDGDISLAISLLTSISKRRSSGVMNQITRAHARGQRCLLVQDFDGAFRYANIGLRFALRHQRLLGALELRVASSSQAERFGVLGMRAAILKRTVSLQDRSLPDIRTDRAFWRWSERCRHIEGTVPGTTSGQERDLIARHRAISAQVDSQTLQGIPVAPRLYAERNRVEESLRNFDLNREDSVWKPSALGLHAIRACLGTRKLITFSDVDGELWWGSVSRDQGFRYESLGSIRRVLTVTDRIRMTVHRALASDGVNEGRLQRQLADAVAELGALLRPAFSIAVGETEDSELVVVPTGRLFAVPWNMLGFLRDRPVTIARSATEWARTPPVERLTTLLTVEGVGLAHSSVECESVAREWRLGKKLCSAKATTRAVLRMFPKVSVAHIAAHTSLRPDNPSFSAVHLVDGPLYIRELDVLSSMPQVVVLSSCASASPLGAKGAEIRGLAARLMARGVRCVIAPVLPVSDSAVANSIPLFHKYLAATMDPARSLLSAQNSIAEGDIRSWVSMRSFVCLGRGG